MSASEPEDPSIHASTRATPTSPVWSDATPEAWRAAAQRDLHGAPFDKKLVTRTHEGLRIQPLYSARDWAHANDPTGAPGIPPFVRGGTTLGAVQGGWDRREERAEPEPDALNRAILDDLEHGATSIDIVLNPAVSEGPGGASQSGAMLLCVDDLCRALEGVHLDGIVLALSPRSAFIEAAALTRAFAEKHGVSTGKARFAFNADPLAELARSGKLPAPVDAMLDRLAVLAGWTAQHLPGSTAVRVDTSPYHEANATAAQDLAYAIATGLTYLRAMERRGLGPPVAARQIVFRVSLSCNIFLAIAKLRAARRLWSAVLAACGVPEEARRGRIEVRTARRSLTHRDPWVNMLRNTASCFAAGVGGADTLVSVPFDEPLGAPDAMARRIARNTLTILSEESHIGAVLDPAGGSWYLESLSDELAKAAWTIFRSIEDAGGMPHALRTGLIAEQLTESYAARLRDIANRAQKVTGVSEFPLPEEPIPVRTSQDPRELAASAIARLAKRTVEPGSSEVVERVRRETWSTDRFDLLTRALRAGVSMPELADAINTGCEPTRIQPLAPHPYAEPFERIRDASDAFAEAHGCRPVVCLVPVGPSGEHAARLDFVTGFFEAGGFEVRATSAAPDAAGSIEAFRAFHAHSGGHIAVVCAADERYPELIPQLVPMLHAEGARTVVLAGRPGDHELVYRNAGVDRFVFMGCDVLETLRDLMHEEGVLP